MKTLLVICARRGSQRLKGKHHLRIAGLPLWSFAVGAALQVKNALTVFSSDDMRIKRELDGQAWRLGNDFVPWVTRPDCMANATAPIHLTLQHAVAHFENLGRKFDVVGFIPANVPTITPRLIRKCIERMKGDKRLTAVMTVREIRDKPEWMWEDAWGEPGMIPAFPEMRTIGGGAYREQDLPKRYVATGTVSLVRTEVLLACTSHKAFAWLGPRIGRVMDDDAIEIHTRRDYELARALMETGGVAEDNR